MLCTKYVCVRVQVQLGLLLFNLPIGLEDSFHPIFLNVHEQIFFLSKKLTHIITVINCFIYICTVIWLIIIPFLCFFNNCIASYVKGLDYVIYL